jgi:hypothetical protein
MLLSHSMKQRIRNAISAYPKLTALAFGLAITLAVGTALGVAAPHLAFASSTRDI